MTRTIPFVPSSASMIRVRALGATVNDAFGRHPQYGHRDEDRIATEADCLVSKLFGCIDDLGGALHTFRDINVTNSSAPRNIQRVPRDTYFVGARRKGHARAQEKRAD
jgi:hypothetical protein